MANYLANPISQAVQKQASAAMQSINWFSPDTSSANIPGPALVYTTPGLSVCGASHDMDAVRKAAFQLGVPLYVVLTAPDTTMDRLTAPERPVIPGQTNEQLLYEHQDALLVKYQLLPSDTVIRLVGKNGELVKMPDVSIPAKNGNTEQGTRGLVNAFQSPIAAMCKASPTPSCGRNGR